jgi:hypothetical protein
VALPGKFGGKWLVLRLGSLHAEMAVLKTLGDFLDDSGRTTTLVHTNVTSAGRADAMIYT